MTRRDFLRTTALTAAVAWAGRRLVVAEEAAGAGPPVVVGLARSEHLYLPYPILAPAGTYPEGKLDWDVVDALVKQSAAAAGLPSPWDLFEASDRVGVIVDVASPPVPLVLVDAVLDQLVRAGVAPERLIIFAAQETDLFAAGFSLRSDPGGVRCLGAQALGYRGGLSRIVLDMCDKLVSVAALRPHPRLGLAGALANYLQALDAPWRMRLLETPAELGSLLTRRALAERMVLHFVDCLQPRYALPTADDPPPMWEYRGLLCGRQPLALDLVGRQILEAQRAAVRGAPWPLEPPPDYLRVAAERYGALPIDPQAVQVRLAGTATDALLPTPPVPVEVPQP